MDSFDSISTQKEVWLKQIQLFQHQHPEKKKFCLPLDFPRGGRSKLSQDQLAALHLLNDECDFKATKLEKHTRIIYEIDCDVILEWHGLLITF